MSTVDPLEAALGGTAPAPEPPAAGTPDEGAAQASDHPILSRFGGDVAKALDAYQQLDREYGQQGSRMGQRISELESTLAEIQGQPGEPEPHGAQNGAQSGGGLADMTVDQLQAWFEDDPAQATAYLIAQGQQMTLSMIEQRLDERLKPVEQNVGKTMATSMAEGLSKKLGADVVARNMDTLTQLMKDDRDLFKGDPTVVFRRMEDAVTAADARAGHQRGASNGATTPPPADVAVLGGSGGRNPAASGDTGPADPADEFRAALVAAADEERDVFGNPKRRTA